MDPASITYYQDRDNFDGGKNALSVPIARCTEGTIFASHDHHPIERRPCSDITRPEYVNTGSGYAVKWWRLAPNADKFPRGHIPQLTCYECDIEPVPVFVDDQSLGRKPAPVPDRRWECDRDYRYESGLAIPVLTWERAPLQLGQIDDGSVPGWIGLRTEQPTGRGNAGDSSSPSFAICADGMLALLGTEIYSSGGRANGNLYHRMLQILHEERGDVVWSVRHPADIIAAAPRPPEPQPEPEPEPDPDPKSAVSARTVKRVVLVYSDGTQEER